jgi:hypothetical protein
MMDEIHSQQKIKELEIHIDWIRSNLGSGPHLDKRIAEISKLRANIAQTHGTELKILTTKTRADHEQ